LGGLLGIPGRQNRSRRDAALPHSRASCARNSASRIHEAQSWLQLGHDYPERRVQLDVWRVQRFSGLPQAHEGSSVHVDAAG